MSRLNKLLFIADRNIEVYKKAPCYISDSPFTNYMCEQYDRTLDDVLECDYCPFDTKHDIKKVKECLD